MSQAALKLVRPEPNDPDVLRFERRDSNRRVMAGKVTSLQSGSDPTDHANRIGTIQLLNISNTGLGGFVQEPVEPGTQIVVYFTPHGPEQGFNRYGHVVRCKPAKQGHQIGVQFVSKTAA